MKLLPFQQSAFCSHRLKSMCSGGDSSGELSMRSLVCALFAAILVWSCRGSVIIHDEELAAKESARFAYTTFVKQDAEAGYSLLSESARQQLSLEQFKQV